MQALINFSRGLLEAGPDAKDGGVSTMRPDARPVHWVHIKVSWKWQKLALGV
jgi:hypothetical protein